MNKCHTNMAWTEVSWSKVPTDSDDILLLLRILLWEVTERSDYLAYYVIQTWSHIRSLYTVCIFKKMNWINMAHSIMMFPPEAKSSTGNVVNKLSLMSLSTSEQWAENPFVGMPTKEHKKLRYRTRPLITIIIIWK